MLECVDQQDAWMSRHPGQLGELLLARVQTIAPQHKEHIIIVAKRCLEGGENPLGF